MRHCYAIATYFIWAVMATILISIPLTAQADPETVWSDHYPQIQRLQGVVLFPTDIETVTVDLEGEMKTQYRFKMYRVRDTGQKVHQDRATWAQENQKLLYELTYGDLETVVKAIESGTVDDLMLQADDVIKRIETEETAK